MLRDPFTRREVGIDEGLVPSIERLWVLGIETTSSCEGIPVYDRAVICFAEPRDPETRKERALFDRDIGAYIASRPDGARQVAGILVKGPWAHMTARWRWTFGDDPDNTSAGSALLLPTPDLPILAKALADPSAGPRRDGQLAKWKAAVAKHNRQQRTRRPQRKAPAIGPGMLRVVTVRDGEKDGPDGGQSRPSRTVTGDHPDHRYHP
jgi:hypothetical protein